MLSLAILAVFWALILIATVQRGPLIIYLFFASTAFTSMSMIPTDFVGGVTILPMRISAFCLLIWALRQHGAFSSLTSILVTPNGFLFLLLFTACATIGAIVLPRIFQNIIQVVPMRSNGFGTSPLSPSSQNITQSLYLILSLFSCLAVYLAAKRSLGAFYPAILWGGIVNVITGILDALFGNTNLLAPFRTASYALNTHHSINGMERIVGLTPEAAAFGTSCVAFASMLFFLRTGLNHSKKLSTLSNFIIIASLLFAVASGSSTAILMTGAFLTIVFAKQLYTLIWRRGTVRRKQSSHAIATILYALAATCGAIFLKPTIFYPAYDLFNELILNKVNGDSFATRSHWNATAWEAFKDTFGLGVGLGSTRTSSWPIALLSNTGVLGALLFFVFAFQCFFYHDNRNDAYRKGLINGARLTLIVVMLGQTIAATLADYGLISAILFGLIIAASDRAYVTTVGRAGKVSTMRDQRSPAW